MVIHLGRLSPAASSDLPERSRVKAPRCPVIFGARIAHRQDKPFCLVLLPAGFAVPFSLPRTRCALTAPFHPYPKIVVAIFGRYIFCGTFPRISPAGRYPAPLLSWSPDFPPRLLGDEATIRPSGPMRW